MLREKYYNAVEDLYVKIRETQDEAITKAAKLCADAVANGHSIHLHDSGHIIDSEIFNRAGGFSLIQQFKYNLDITSNARLQKDYEDSKDRDMEGLATYALKAANVYPNDVLFIGSVSGISFNIVDLAVAAKKMGVKVIALTSVEYSKTLDSLHPTNKKLYEENDVLIDNCAPFGDAMLNVEKVKQPFIPASGLAAAYIMWAIMADLLELLLEAGITPGILGSVNYPPNVEYNIDLKKLYEEKGH